VDSEIIDFDKEECSCLGVRLLKIDSSSHVQLNSSCKEKNTPRLLHCLAVVNQDSTSSIDFSSLSALTPLPKAPPATAAPSSDLAAVVSKLRQMTATVAELQIKLGKALEAKKIQQQKQQQGKEKNHKKVIIKLTRF
jgi:hypothetical protein